MPQKHLDPGKFLPLTPAVFHILLALADGERHGYAIMQEIQRDTSGRVRMGPGTLYGTIKRLITIGFIVETDTKSEKPLTDERRRYYRLTELGQQVVVAEAARLAAAVDLAHAKRLLGDITS